MERTFSASLVGMRYYAPPFDIKKRLGGCDDEIALHREPDNPHDSAAVAVHVDGHKVGHLDRESAAAISALLAKGASYSVALNSKVGSGGRDKTIPLKIVLTLGRSTKGSPPKPVSGPVAAVYCITVKDGIGVYVGQANDVNKRIASHWKDLLFGCHANPHLQEAWSNHGAEALSVSILEEAPTGLSPLALQRWLGEHERQAIAEARKSSHCLNVQDGEVVTTRAALSEYQHERKKSDTEHDSRVRERKRQIKAEIEALEASRWSQARQFGTALRSKRDELSASIRKHTGLRGFFSEAVSPARLGGWKIALEEVCRQLAQLDAKDGEFSERIKALRDERRTLLTVKQRETKIEGIFLRGGITRTGRGRIS